MSTFVEFEKITVQSTLSRVFSHGLSYAALLMLLLAFLGFLEDGATTLVLLFAGIGISPFVLSALTKNDVRYIAFAKQLKSKRVDDIVDLHEHGGLSFKSRKAIRCYLFREHSYILGDKPLSASIFEGIAGYAPDTDIIRFVSLALSIAGIEWLGALPQNVTDTLWAALLLCYLILFVIKGLVNISFTYAFMTMIVMQTGAIALLWL